MAEKICIFGESLILKEVKGRRFHGDSLTGASRVTNQIAFRLADMKYDIAILDYAFAELGHILTPSGKTIVPVYGIGKEKEALPTFGKDKLQSYLETLKPGLLILIGDLRMFDYVINNVPNTPNIVAALTVDGSPIPKSWIPTLEKFDEIVSVSQFGFDELRKAGIKSKLIPFGVDTKTYYPLDIQTLKIVKKRAKLPEDKWIWQFVGRNQARKNITDLFKAYKTFNKKYPNESILYINTDPLDPAGMDLFELADFYGIKKNLKFTTNFINTTQSQLNAIYNVADCHISASLAEGFCLPVLESMSTGTMQIVPDNTAIAELVKRDCGELVNIETMRFNMAGVYQYFPSVDDMVTKMIKVYENPELKKTYGRNAFEKARGEYYNWDKIVEKWRDLIDSY